MIVLGIFVLIIVIAVAFYVANEFYLIAVIKGFDDMKYLWWTFLLFPVGAALVIALPDKRNFDRLIKVIGDNSDSQDKNNEISDKLPEL